jgi:transposase
LEATWDFPGGGYCCPECGTPFTGLDSDHLTELLDWQVIVRVAAHCRRRYRRACSCRVPATVTASGPPKAIGKGLFTNGFIAMLLTERFVAGRSMNSLVTGLSRQGAEISTATLAGTCAQAGALLASLADAITERSREKAHEAWDTAITVIDEARKQQTQAPGLQEPAKKALATLDREWDGLIAHRDHPMIGLDNKCRRAPDPPPGRDQEECRRSRNGDTARNAAVIWTVTETARNGREVARRLRPAFRPLHSARHSS